VRLVFLIPDLRRDLAERVRARISRFPVIKRWTHTSPLCTTKVFGGTLNLMRHCALARKLGADAVLATQSGEDHYGEEFGIGRLPTIRWGDRRNEDVCVIPDVYSSLIDQVAGTAVAYLQHPKQTRSNFDYTREDVFIWTDSAPMLSVCKATYPGKPVTVIPNIVDPEAFPFIPQPQRRERELVALPRKGSDFIDEVFARYRDLGGRFWQLERVHGLPFREYTARMRTPQVFLASADVEGCALPPQECMAAGIVVLGKNADGANFCMQHEETAIVAESVTDAAEGLRLLEDPERRDSLSRAGHRYIRRFFPECEPTEFWRHFLATLT